MNLEIPILMYHQVSNEPHPNYLEYTVTVKAFSAQMKMLKLLGYVPISFNQLMDYKNGVAKLPPKPVIITFDDGMQDAIDNAVPILKNSGFTAVFYISTDYVGKKSSWMLPEVNVEFQVIDWATVKSLDNMGFEVGSHTISHPHLDRISSDDCYRELTGSRRKLEEVLRHEVRHMAYPFGDFNESVKTSTYEAGYYTACTTEEAVASLNDDMLMLPRLNMGMDAEIINFLSKINSDDSPIGIFARRMQAVRYKMPRPIKKIIKKLLYRKNTFI
jgi:peptidoglycan/xylan/chitin deacetylase (PgdA/CDA1 family)